MKRKKT
jgi:hypothetical protein